jgi:hypothetical protein
MRIACSSGVAPHCTVLRAKTAAAKTRRTNEIAATDSSCASMG